MPDDFRFQGIKEYCKYLDYSASRSKLILSKDFLSAYQDAMCSDNPVICEPEPTTENMIIFMQSVLRELLPERLMLAALKLYETKDSYAEWLEFGN